MKKTVSALLIVATLLAIAALAMTGCALFKSITPEEAKTKLEEAGYQVSIMTGKEYVETDDAIPALSDIDLEYFLYAIKGNEVIYLFFFDSVDSASDNANFIFDSGLTSGQSNNVVYLATKQARKDAGL